MTMDQGGYAYGNVKDFTQLQRFPLLRWKGCSGNGSIAAYVRKRGVSY